MLYHAYRFERLLNDGFRLCFWLMLGLVGVTLDDGTINVLCSTIDSVFPEDVLHEGL